MPPVRTPTTRRIRTPKQRQREQRDLDQTALSDALLARHLQESWPKRKESSLRWFPDGEPPGRYHENIRTVAVVGAGASIPMVSVAEELAKEVERDLDKDQNEREVELDRLENVYGLKREDFETRLSAVCRTPETERRVKEKISEQYRHHHPSLLTYELLAHLLHHRYLDTIISFNFDELLDQSIEDELGVNEYTKVVTEGDVDPHGDKPNPLYIKMHGTAAEPESLRFTRERYYWMPSAIVKLIEEQFNVDHLVLINIGCTMASFDFQHLLRMPKELEIYHLDPKPLKDDVLGAIEQQRRKARERKETIRSEDCDKPELADFSAKDEASIDPNFLEDLFGEVLGKLESLCNAEESGPARWRSTLRHRAVVKLLRDFNISNADDYISYLRRRTILEIAFAAAKGRGVVSIAAMVNDRCGRYFDLYRCRAGDHAEDWLKLCEAGGLQESEEFPDTYEVLESLRDPHATGDSSTPNIHRLKMALPSKLAAHTARNIDVAGRDRAELIELLTETIQYLQRDTDIEIHSSDDRVCSKLFTQPLPLTTLTALQGWTAEILEAETDYDELWLVAETGSWLGDPRLTQMLQENCQKIRLIRAFDDAPQLPPNIDVDLRRLPWGRHNRHMTIACNQGKPRNAIYFVRRLRSATVTPVCLEHQKDLRRVAKAFEQLWEEAGAYEGELGLESELSIA